MKTYSLFLSFTLTNVSKTNQAIRTSLTMEHIQTILFHLRMDIANSVMFVMKLTFAAQKCEHYATLTT